MNIELTYDNETANIIIVGNIDSTTGTELSEKLQDIIENPDIKNANFDLKGVNTINSAGIGKFLKFYKHIESKNGSFKIVKVSDKLMRLFKDINLDKIISISK